MSDSLARLQERLGYVFTDGALLELALRHRSAGAWNNERLEFLGDAVLGYLVAERLFNDRPGDREDRLTLMRAQLVRREALFEIARHLELEQVIRLGTGAASGGGHRRASVLADAVEAIIGAVHQDGGIGAARGVVRDLWRDAISKVDVDVLKDPKTRLQEHLQSRGEALPVYTVASTEGADHQKIYEVHCVIESEAQPGVGIGRSRREAEKNAAADLLERLA